MIQKEERYLKISKEIVEYVGGLDNIQGVAHCATRLRIVLKDNDLLQMEKVENVDLAKGAFLAGDQLQIIFGAGLVNDVYKVFASYTHMENMSLSDVKQQSAQKLNPLQAVIKSLSDVFVEIMPAILAAALLLGLTGVLGKWDVVTNNDALYAINKLASLASNGIFSILPMAVCYSATKRYGGRPILGIVVGAIMLDASLANAYDIGKEGFNPEVLNIFGLNIELVGFQGGIIIALMMGFIIAKLDQYFERKVPDVIKLLVSPMLTVFISTVLLFTIVGPVGRELGNIITGSLVWMTNNLGPIGYMAFAGLQQVIVITGLHHILGAVEATLIADTGRNFLNPLMSVALMGQGGAVLGYLLLNWKNVRTRELCIPSFISTLFGISEPAIFGINLRYKFPLIAGCIAAAIAGAYCYFTDLAALGFGTTAVPGIAITDPNGNGYLHYIIAHIIALGVGIALCFIFGKAQVKKETITLENDETQPTVSSVSLIAPIQGTVKNVTACDDAVFSAETMGKGIVIEPTNGDVIAPADATVEFVFPSKHAIGLKLNDGSKVLIHCGIDTVNLNGEGFEVFVKKEQKITQGQKLSTMDLALIKSKGFSTQTIMVVTEKADLKQVIITPDQKEVLTIK